MIRRCLTVAAACAALVLIASPTRAQIPEPTPTPDPHTYDDPGMTYVAPPDAVPLGRRQLGLDELTTDLQPVAVWVLHPGKEDARTIQIQMEQFTGPPNEWEAQFESQMHGATDGLLIKSKTPMALTNGMPATLVEMTFGDGFDAKKMFAVVFADGQRGIAIAELGRVGEVGQDEAKRVLHDAKAVRYPMDQP